MKKQLAAALAAALSLAVLAGAWFLLSGGEEAPEADSLPALLSAGTEVLDWIEVTGASGGYRARYQDGELTVEGLEGLPLDSAACSRLLSAVSSLEAVQAVKGGEARLADFGLSDPLLRIEASRTDGIREVLAVGDQVPGAEGRYVLRDGAVYVAGQSGLEPFFFQAEDFLSRQVTPGGDGLTVERASVSGRGLEQPVVLELADSQAMAGYQVNFYNLRSPLEYPADPSQAEAFLYSAFGLEAEAVAAVRPDDEALAGLGLADPWARLEVSYRDGGAAGRVALSLSEPDASGRACALADGLPVAYLVRTEGLFWTAASWEELASKEVLAPSVYQLKALTVERPEGTLELSLEWEGETCRVFLGEQELTWDNFRNFYYTLVSIRAEEVLFDGLPDPSGLERLAAVTFDLGDAGRRTAVYYRESDRRVCAEVEDRGFRLAYTQLAQMLDRLDRLAAGETVEARY